MYFKIEYFTDSSSFEYSIRTEHPDIKAVMTGLDSFIGTVIELPKVERDEEDIENVRAQLYSAVDEIVEEMQNDG